MKKEGNWQTTLKKVIFFPFLLNQVLDFIHTSDIIETYSMDLKTYMKMTKYWKWWNKSVLLNTEDTITRLIVLFIIIIS